MRNISSIILTLALLAGSTPQAQDAPPDISAELEKARAFWKEAEGLGEKIREAMTKATGSNAAEIDGLIDRRKKAYEDTAAVFDQALKKDPQHAEGLAEFAHFWIGRGEFALARHFFERSWASSYAPAKGAAEETTLDPEKCGARAEKELTQAEKADVLRALGGIAERAGELPVALDLYRAALKRFPADARNRVSLAISLCAAGAPADAAMVLVPEGEGQLASKSLYDQHKGLLALASYTLGFSQEQLGKLESAIANYKISLETAADAEASDVRDNARMAIARLEDRSDDFELKQKEHDEKLKGLQTVNASRERIHLKPLEEASERELFEEARVACERAVALKKQALADPDFAELLEQVHTNQIKSAELDAIRIENRKGAAGCALYHAAEELLDKAVAKYPRFPRLNFELAGIKLQLRRFSLARQFLDVAELFDPNDIAVLNLRGSVLLELGQWEEAAAVFRRLLVLDSENGYAHYGLGRALTALRSDEATCAAALDAFSRAEKLGVRDERMNRVTTLFLKDGQSFEGWIRKVGNEYIVMEEGSAPFRIGADQVVKAETGPGLRDQAADMLVRYRNGEKPPVVQRLTGRRHEPRQDLLGPGSEGTIFAP